MPYAVVETISNIENNKLLAVPETWVVWKNEAIGYLYWPNVKSVSELNALMLNNSITPSTGWKKQACKIIYQSILSLTSALKILEILQNQYKMNASVEANQIPINPPDGALGMIVAKNQHIHCGPELDNSVNPQQDEDSFGNLPVPQLAQTIQSKMSTEDMYTFCKTKKEEDPLGDMYTASSRSNLAAENNWTRSISPAKAAWADGDHDNQDDKNEQNWSTRTKSQSVFDPLEDVKHSSQLYNLIYELKNIIISNQEEVKQNIREGFIRVHESITSLIKHNERMQSKIIHKLNRTVVQDNFNLDILKTVEDVKLFEQQLNNAQYRKKLQTFIDFIIHHETRTTKRMKLMFDMLFHTELLYQFNWSGKHGKKPLKYYINIKNLFEYIGTTPMHRAKQIEVSNFFIKTMQNVMRLQLSVTSRDTSINAMASTSNNIDITQVETIPNVENEGVVQNDIVQQGKLYGPNEMIEEGEKNELNESMEHDESLLNEGQTLSKDLQTASDNSFEEKYINRITCVEELDTFENQLNDLKVKQQVHRWIEETVGLEANVEKRMIEFLDQLIDKKVLQTFSWVDEKRGKRSLQRYQNFVKLFEYASRTMIHQTIIFNHGYVSNFFMN